MKHHDFISQDKSLLIAPAGYGKTYALAECLRYTPDDQKQLILTHTHAGIASIKEKIRELDVPSSKYHIETISGFAQKYVESLYSGSDKIKQGDDGYFNYVIDKSSFLFELNSIKRIIKNSYDGLFVDEYQDCTLSQHKMIMLLAEVLPTRLLGDPMQGIFNFDKNNPLVNFDEYLVDFKYRETLIKPWRWYKEGNNKQLGDSLKEIRTLLDSSVKEINISLYPGISLLKIKEGDIYDASTVYRRGLTKLITNTYNSDDLKSLLVILPDDFRSSSAALRSDLKARIDFSKQLVLLEAIDDKDYYTISKNIDNILSTIHTETEKIKILKDQVFIKLFNVTNINEWFGTNHIKKRRKQHQENSKLLIYYIESFIQNPTLDKLSQVILFLKNSLKLKTKRRELLNTILKAVHSANFDKTTVYEAMTQRKNSLRRVGRKVDGKCLGTTLLTKGLEFDTVVVLDAHKFQDMKHFYVAITRACKRLFIFSEKEILTFK